MENFDDLMRHKYDNDDPAGRFEFREEYWEQARVLIEADEARRRKKRRWLLWWCFSGLLLLGAGIGWWQMTSGNAATGNNESGRIGLSEPHTNPNTGGPTASIPDQHNSTNTAADPGSPNVNTTNNTHQPENNTNTSTNTASSSRPSTHSATAAHQPENTTSKHSTSRTHSTDHNVTGNQPKPRNITASAGQTSQKNGINPANAVAPLPTDGSLAQPSPAPARNSAGGEQNNAGNSTLPESPVANQGTTPGAAPGKLEKLLEELFTLPLPLNPVSDQTKPAAKKPEQVPPPPMAATQIKPVKDKRFTFGVSTAASAYENAPDQRWFGFTGGLFGAYQWNPHWSVSLGLGARYHPGSWIDSTTTTTGDSLWYSFGYKQLHAERRTLGLLALETPVAVQWTKRLLTVEGGVAPGRLLYALERFKQTEKSSLEATKTTRNRLERGDTAPFGKQYVNVFGGIGIRCTRDVSLSLRGNYRFGNIVAATDASPAVKGGLSIDLGLTWKIF